MVFGKAKLVAFSHLFPLDTRSHTRFLPYALACIHARAENLYWNAINYTDITAGFGSFWEQRTRSVSGQLLRRTDQGRRRHAQYVYL